MKKICKPNGIIFLIFIGIISIGIIVGIIIICIIVSREGKISTTQSNENKDLSSQTNVSQEAETSWDEGFNASWVGTYKSLVSADYAVTFVLGVTGNYILSYGEGIITTYSGKYNKNFHGGVSESRLQYTITGLRVIGFDEKTITISSSWKLPSGNTTQTYVLYRQ